MRRLEIRSYQQEWPLQFKEASNTFQEIFGNALTDIHHIGSTSIPGMAAKPVIDILAEVRDIGELETFNHQMELEGFVARGEHGVPGRRYFVRAEGNVHTHHVHMFANGSDQVKRHLAFRDYLRKHPVEAERYRSLKMRIAEEGVKDVKLYQERKAPLIRELQESAEKWMEARNAKTP
ncbi:GrpB family protein [Bhargavaea ginsengi]|uniref:GrpB family protein n=1 Tax=Bhargavaea ginsengi TaxID=426757 RepID=UPI0020413F33|nr:GrpB family protein [Bhargavaea ginsengi]MCM3088067.1 GrpB family protein [Bhargavaea ginsengi]